jgi:ubiquinone/menaquinone biosynthesis C-methylase UbiE
MQEPIIHPQGFKIFLPREKWDSCDEYAEGDHYGMSLDSPFHRPRVEMMLELVGDSTRDMSLPPRLLDLGCGKGYMTEEIKQAFPNIKIVACDYSVSAIMFAHKNFSDIEFCVADAYNLPFAQSEFDMVLMGNIWEHVPDPCRMLEAVSFVLKPGGSLLLSTPSRFRFQNLVRACFGLPAKFLSSQHVTEYAVGQVMEQLHWFGYDVKKVLAKKVDWPEYSNIFKRILVYFLAKPIARFLAGKQKAFLEPTIYFWATKNNLWQAVF